MSQGQNAKTEIQTKVKSLLDEVDSSIISDQFFQSEMKDDFSKWDDEETTDAIKLFKEEQVSFEHVDNHGGEGAGENYWSVYKFTDKNTKKECYVKFDGWYASYSGSEFDKWFFVEPTQRMITFYE